MFKCVLVLAFVAYTAAIPLSAPASDDAHAEVTLQNAVVRADGFDYALETSNSIHEVQSGDVKGNIHGDFSWVSPEGQLVKVSYVADESGYHPQGDLLPTSPPIPEAIVKSIDYIASHPPKEENKQGK